MKRVLVFCCSSGIGQEIYRSLCHRRDVELFGIDSDPNSPGKVLYGKRFYSGVPTMHKKEELLKYLKSFIKLNEIGYVFPGNDDSINFLKTNEDILNTSIITSELNTCIVARSKRATYKLLGGIIKVPEIFVPDYNLKFPLFIKPDMGEGSKGCHLINSMTELDEKYTSEHIICEYLPGDEYTIDCLTDSTGELLYASPRKRSSTRAGMSIVTEKVTDSYIVDEAIDIAKKINQTLRFKGSWFFQLKHSFGGKLCLLEVAPRIPGASAFSRLSGVNLPLLSLYIESGMEVKVGVHKNPVRVMKTYVTHPEITSRYDNVYMDLDDTIIIKGRVNHSVMGFIYYQKSIGKTLHLLSRHSGNIDTYLSKFHIPQSIFTSITRITDSSPKSKYIANNSIVIDDSFSEREEITSYSRNIYAYDVDVCSSFTFT